MVRTVIRVAILGLIIHALYQFVPLYVRYQQFKDDVKQTALFARSASEDQLAQRVLAHAEQRGVPVALENVQVRRLTDQVFVDVVYQQPVKVLPWYVYPWDVHIATSPFVVPARDDIGGRVR
jgi:hypothetical protein